MLSGAASPKHSKSNLPFTYEEVVLYISPNLVFTRFEGGSESLVLLNPGALTNTMNKNIGSRRLGSFQSLPARGSRVATFKRRLPSKVKMA